MMHGSEALKIIQRMDQKEIFMLEDQLQSKLTMNGCQYENSKIKEEYLENLRSANLYI